MIRRILMSLTLLVLSSGPVYAEWVVVSNDLTREATAYVSPDLVLRKENLVTMWHLFDYKTIQIGGTGEHPFLSLMAQAEYDCEEARLRVLTMTVFSGNMGRGHGVSSAPDADRTWKPIVPESIAHALWKVACSK